MTFPPFLITSSHSARCFYSAWKHHKNPLFSLHVLQNILRLWYIWLPRTDISKAQTLQSKSKLLSKTTEQEERSDFHSRASLLDNRFLNWRKQTDETVATVPKSRVRWRDVLQSGYRVSKKVFWNFSYLSLWHTMWFHAEKLLKALKFWKSLNSLYKSGSWPKKSPQKKSSWKHSNFENR